MSLRNEKMRGSGSGAVKIVLKVFLRTLAVIGVTLLLVLILLLGTCFLALHGPSPAFRSQFAMFAYETSALKWLPRLFLGDEQFDRIISENIMPEAEDGTASEAAHKGFIPSFNKILWGFL